MYLISPNIKLLKTLLSTAIKLYGTDCEHYTKLESKQDEVYGIYGGISPLQKNNEDLAYSLYGNPEAIPSIVENNQVFDSNIEESNEKINIKHFKSLENIRVLLPASVFRVGAYNSGFYQDSGYVWTISPENILSGDLIIYKNNTGSKIVSRILYPEIKGKDETYLIRFLLSNVGDNYV